MAGSLGWAARRLVRTFRPSRDQCHALFDWVLTVIEAGPPPHPEPVPETVDTFSWDIESARAEVAYVLWYRGPKTLAFVEILSY
jgi:hypothetical protein